MNSLTAALLVLMTVFGTTLCGMWLRRRLPEHHFSAETKDTVRISMGLVATMTALILGLLVAGANSAYDAKRSEMIQMASKIGFLDRILANYGPESQPVRQILKQATENTVLRLWAVPDRREHKQEPSRLWSDTLPRAIQSLSPNNTAQSAFKTQAAAVTADIGQLRWLIYEQSDSAISLPLLGVVIAWMAFIFGSVGHFSPPNATAVAAQLLAALAVSAAIGLILELDAPFDGLIRISDRHLVDLTRTLGR